MGVTYNAGTNRIVILGYTQAVPCTCLDIWNADQAGGWGVVFRTCGNQYYLTAGIVVGDGIITTWFADESMQIIFANGVATSASLATRSLIQLNALSHFRLGKLWDDAKKITSKGCCIHDLNTLNYDLPIYAPTSSSVCEVYGSHFTNVSGRDIIYLLNVASTSKVYNCEFADGYELNMYSTQLYGIRNTNTAYGISRIQATTVEDVTIMKVVNEAAYTHTTGETEATFKNFMVKDVGYTFYVWGGCTLDQHLINWTVDTWNVGFYTVSSTAKAYRKYEIDLKVIQSDLARTPISGATVKIWDKDNALVVNEVTDVNGEIGTQTLTCSYYDFAHGGTPVMKTPHLLKIYKNGSLFVTEQKYLYMDYKRREVISLVKAQQIQFCDDKLILQLAPESAEDDRLLFEVI